MISIAPTITAENAHQFRAQAEVIERIAKRAHVDFSDGEFSPIQMLNPAQAWKPNVQSDFHLMFSDALRDKETIVAHSPDLVVLHAESNNLNQAINYYQKFKIKVGLALLPDTKPEDFRSEVELVSHVLIFAGKLGYQGGVADLTQLDKIGQLKEINPNLELGWDGGINDQNAAQLADAGINVLNIGGFIQKSENPDNAYDIIDSKVNP